MLPRWLAVLNILSAVALGLARPEGTCSVPSPSYRRTQGRCLPAELCGARGRRPVRAARAGARDRVSASWSPVEAQYIVRFHEYRRAEAQHRLLAQGLGPEGEAWGWIRRNNKAAEYPTDFGLIRVAPGGYEALKARLQELSFVKDVHPDFQITRALAWESYPDEEDAGWAGGYGAFHGECDGDTVRKFPGRLRTRPTIGLDKDVETYSDSQSSSFFSESHRKLLLMDKSHSLTGLFEANKIYSLGYTGQNVKVGVFDTGVRGDHPHIRNIKERTNWTHEPTLDDGLGHGSFVAGVIASSDDGCPGLAPDVDLHTFRVFTNDQVSYTSWFLDAFNYAMATEMEVVNLSIGGPDYLDRPFVDKVWEVTANGIIMTSAIGNDGPLYGTLNNPADQNDVIGVGGISFKDKIAHFSSRGMSSWELPLGYGRIKPDIMAYAQDVRGSRITTGCRSLSGTSVASPVACGAVCLLASTIPKERRWDLLNPASMKQALVHGAERLPGLNIYEQGAGRATLAKSMAFLQDYTPQASLIPGVLNLTDCPYMWPFCTQPLYAHAMPVMINATILNGMGVIGHLEGPPRFEPADVGGHFVNMQFEYSTTLWPWSGYLAIYIRVNADGQDYNGQASGTIVFDVSSPYPGAGDQRQSSTVRVPFIANVIPTPSRELRVLWDQFHSVKYPPQYLPRDNLDIKNDILDWHGDHPHTNFHQMFNYLVEHGYYLEILGSPFTCFDALQYGALLMVDLEDEYYPDEILKLNSDVREKGLGVVVFAEWYNVDNLEKMRFYDDNTRTYWTPATGGANVPALNDLLEDFGVAFGDLILSGNFELAKQTVRYASGANLVKFPEGGFLHSFKLGGKATGSYSSQLHPVLGLTSVGEGHVVAYGDSGCLDGSYQVSDCYAMLKGFLEYSTGRVDLTESSEYLSALLDPNLRLETALGSDDAELPKRFEGVNFTEASFVLRHPLTCYSNSPGSPDLVTSGAPPRSIESKELLPSIPTNPDVLSNSSTQAPNDMAYTVQVTGLGSSQILGSVTTWCYVVGIVVVVGLYQFTRQRKGPIIGQGETSKGTGEHEL
ncbi:unnamed protein product [Ostreobium quekettii]|uniref:Peptidase S8/S53 domain-containing protein n=1 Tax=Ostreobium quekettii TaxID=121088 RepID=A0A8S1ISP9_9CHLO|nr:unnamed protein product [Ostreobium quekettii]|eukprot:evm.model.scf_2435EXC.1 EVM.evm.TU.scf_2435EXC.1   scf_2435EXC:4641-13952(+)